MEEGDVTLLKFTHPNGSGTGYDNRTTFTLDTSTYDNVGDGTTAVAGMLNKTFFITGLRIICPTGSQLGGLIIDGRNIMDYNYLGNAAGDDILIDGLPQAFATPATDQNAPTIKDLFDVYAIPARTTIAIWAQALTSNDIDAFFTGFLLNRIY
jgi:hypothetical protein